MSIMVPLVPVLIIGIIIGFVLLVLEYLVLWMGCKPLWAIWKANIFHEDLFLWSTPKRAWLESLKKKNPGDLTYKRKGLLNKSTLKAIDPMDYDPNDSVRFYGCNLFCGFPGKMWPKTIPRMAATNECLRVISRPIKSEDVKDAENAPIKHNEHLYKIAKMVPRNALKLLKVENDSEIESYARQFVILPDNVDQSKAEVIEKIVKDLVEEVKEYRDYLKDLLIPSSIFALGEMMAAYPDRAVNNELTERLDLERTRAANAGQMSTQSALMIVAGITVLFVAAIIIVVALK
jgi:hypothetical protein